jgi:peptidoglycan/xylan/chitin deacetylase (PgdA/CDA1 family)
VRVSVLLYHDVIRGADRDASGFRGPGAARCKLGWDQFIEHLDSVGRATAGPPVTVDDLLARRAPERAWAITFDDGGASALAAGEELVRRGWRGHFFCVSDRIGERGFLDADEIVALDRMGHVIGSHSRSHPARISNCPWDRMLDEWRVSAERLGELLERPVTCAGVPGGFYSRALARAAAAAGLTALFTSEPVRVVRSVDGCAVIGRYANGYTTPAHTAAEAAAGHLRPWLTQRAGWNARKVPKRIAGDSYSRLRARLLDRR